MSQSTHLSLVSWQNYFSMCVYDKMYTWTWGRIVVVETSHWMSFLPMVILDNVEFITLKVYEAKNSSLQWQSFNVSVCEYHTEFFCVHTTKLEITETVELSLVFSPAIYWLIDKLFSASRNNFIHHDVLFSIQLWESSKSQLTEALANSSLFRIVQERDQLQYLRLQKVLHPKHRF